MFFQGVNRPTLPSHEFSVSNLISFVPRRFVNDLLYFKLEVSRQGKLVKVLEIYNSRVCWTQQIHCSLKQINLTFHSNLRRFERTRHCGIIRHECECRNVDANTVLSRKDDCGVLFSFSEKIGTKELFQNAMQKCYLCIVIPL